MEGLPPLECPCLRSPGKERGRTQVRLSSPRNLAGLRDLGREAGAGGSMYALPRRAPLCRPAAHAALSSLRASGWIDHSTRTVSVHFALYNPPTRLLSSVSLHAELLPAGGLALSPLVESLAVFHSDSALWSSPTLPEVGPPAPPLHVDPRAPLAGCSPPPPGPTGMQSPALGTVGTQCHQSFFGLT